MHSSRAMNRSTSEVALNKPHSTLYADDTSKVNELKHNTDSTKNLLDGNDNVTTNEDVGDGNGAGGDDDDDEALQQIRERLRQENLTRFDNFNKPTPTATTTSSTPNVFSEKSSPNVNNNNNNDLASELAVTAAIGSLSADWHRLDAATLLRLAIGVLLVGNDAEQQLARLRNAIERTVSPSTRGGAMLRKSPNAVPSSSSSSSTTATATAAATTMILSSTTAVVASSAAKSSTTATTATTTTKIERSPKQQQKSKAKPKVATPKRAALAPASALLRLPTPIVLTIFNFAG